VRIVCSVL